MGDDLRLSHQSLTVLAIYLQNLNEEFSGIDLIKLTGLSAGTLYPILLRFEEKGLLKSHWEEGDPKKLKRPRKRFYKITASGEGIARRALTQLQTAFLLTPSMAGVDR